MLGLLKEWIESIKGSDKQEQFFDYLTEQSIDDFSKALQETTISCNEFVNSLNEIKRGSI
jgi:hypothetical protein|nr:MAG TPA: hypothetical protein [Caudoviricetes sp.]